MLATTHVITGGVAGLYAATLTHNPILAAAIGFGAGFVSHFVCDSFPHMDAPFKINYEDGRLDRPIFDARLAAWAMADSVIACALILFLWHKIYGLNILSPFAWGALGAYLPDFLDVTPKLSRWLRAKPGFKQFHALHIRTHHLWVPHFPMPQYIVLGIVTQLLAILLAASVWLALI